MFFFIVGIQPRTVLLNEQNHACPRCHHFPMEKKRVDHYLSLFFIPLFPVKKGIPFLFCPECKTGTDQDGKIECLQEGETGRDCGFCHRYFSRDYSFCPFCGKPVN